MNTAVVNVKVNPEVKKKAQKVAEELGFTLSSLINGYLKQLIISKTVHFNLEEKPNEYFIKSMKESVADVKAGRVISFKSGDDAIAYLDGMIAEDERKSKKNRL